MRIAVDIDSTLHHYWDVLSEVSLRRFGVELPYEEQLTWGITRLRPEQMAAAVAETHSDERIRAGRPYPGAVQAVRRWHRAGHFIHVTSHREGHCQAATGEWLTGLGLPFDELRCDFDKVAHCARIGIDVLIDDAPHDLVRALEHGIVVATLRHPWNVDVCEEEEVISADSWPELEEKLAPLLAGATRPAAVGD
jgi:5'(3')-deoxyribonucleotidase